MRDNQITRKLVYTATSCCMAAAILTAGFSMQVHAVTSEAEMPVAGMDVALNSYYARTSASSQEELENPVVGIPAETPVEETPSAYENIAVSRCYDYVNVRSLPNTDCEIVGKIYDGCAATILERVDDWYRIESGNVEGYIKAEYFVTGAEAEALVDELATKIATVNTTTLLVRAGAGTDFDCLTMVPLGEEFVIMEEDNNWAKIEVDASTNGWVSMDYLDVVVKFDVAISIEEENAKIAAQEEAKRRAEADRQAYLAAQARAAQAAQAAQEEAARAAQEAQAETAGAEQEAPAEADGAGQEEVPVQAPQEEVSVPAASANSALREAMVSYALQFVGNPYVYGGNSLTNGTDCSGFVKLIYQEFGYSLTRRASLQYHDGRVISLDAIQPGDLIFYPEPYNSREIGHVAMYIGNNQVVHASTAKTGIKISSLNYRTIYGAVSIID